MVTWAAEKLSPYPSMSPELKLKALQLAFFHPGEFEFAYEQTRTLTAEEAFTARHGNCMSFTSLFVGMARAMDLPAFLMTVRRQPEVERDGGLVVVNRHVVAGFRSPNRIYTYDFYITSTQPYLSRDVIDDLMASAIYHTNIGGLSIREDDLDGALRNLEIATILAPDWAPAWVNLGVVQMRLGQHDEAVDSLQQALLVEPGNSSALVNLVEDLHRGRPGRRGGDRDAGGGGGHSKSLHPDRHGGCRDDAGQFRRSAAVSAAGPVVVLPRSPRSSMLWRDWRDSKKTRTSLKNTATAPPSSGGNRPMSRSASPN